MTKAKSNPIQYEIAKRARNFRWDIEKLENQATENANYYFNLEIIKDGIIKFSSSDAVRDISKQELLYRIFSQIYRLIKVPKIDSLLFCDGSPLNDSVYEACLFTSLCSFLHTTKRIKGTSLRDFVLRNHPLNFNNMESPNYRTSLLDSEADRLRKMRNRLLLNGSVYIKRTQWAGMPKDAEYEWLFFYALDNADEAIRDTFKRIGNLYTEVDNALRSTEDDGYCDRIKNAYKKFLSKLKKIRYENVLNLYQEIYSHINGNKEFYGLNMYRFERRLMPYCIMSDVKKLLAYQDAEDKVNYLMRTVTLRGITFPKVYDKLITSPCPSNELGLFACEFPRFLENIAISNCLIIDELVEKGIFGTNWERLFCDILNAMTEKVFYAPTNLDFTVTKESQTEYEALLAAPVFTVLCGAADTPLDFGVYL